MNRLLIALRNIVGVPAVASTYVIRYGLDGPYLAESGTWSADREDAMRFVDADEACALVSRFACEPRAFDVVSHGDVRRAA